MLADRSLPLSGFLFCNCDIAVEVKEGGLREGKKVKVIREGKVIQGHHEI